MTKKVKEIEAEEIKAVIVDDKSTTKKNVTDDIKTEDSIETVISKNNNIVKPIDTYSSAIVIAQTWEDKVNIAERMIDGGLVPRSFAGDGGAVVSAIEMGMELGLGPWASLNNIVVIQGRATLTLNAMLSLARSKGVLVNVIKDFELIPVEIRTREGIKKSTTRGTKVEITRGEDIYSPSGKLLDSRVSTYSYTKLYSEAATAELTEKDNWKKMPRLMLRARAITEALRLYAADIMLGMYESSEIGDVNNIIIDVKE